MSEMTTISGPNWSVDVEQNWVDVTSDHPTPNRHWRYTDHQGHEHHYEGHPGQMYPTLEYVVDEEHWCEGDEGWMPHDPHMVVDESHYECKLCGEVIEPKMDPPLIPKQIPGSRSITITGLRRPNERITMVPTNEQIDRIEALVDERAEMAELETVIVEMLQSASDDQVVWFEAWGP